MEKSPVQASNVACYSVLQQKIWRIPMGTLTIRLDEIRSKIRPYAEAAGYLTYEDFFREIS